LRHRPLPGGSRIQFFIEMADSRRAQGFVIEEEQMSFEDGSDMLTHRRTAASRSARICPEFLHRASNAAHSAAHPGKLGTDAELRRLKEAGCANGNPGRNANPLRKAALGMFYQRGG